MPILRLFRPILICFAALATNLASTLARAEETALDRYVAAPDPAYAWKLVHSATDGDGLATFVLELTSQSWRSAEEVDRPVWKHWLTIVRPSAPSFVSHPHPSRRTAFLFIGGGSNRDPAPQAASPRVVALARESQTVCAELFQVPNQPLTFHDLPNHSRSEDDLIAYSRVRYMATGDENWLVRLAMVKSGVRALDAIQAFLATPEGGSLAIEQFVVAGGSKRGWTTWLVGLEDQRVVAIVPLVIDALNSEQITRHHYQAYGFFSPALNDYVAHKLFPQRIGTPEYRAVLRIEDPYEYRDRERLKLPKFLINAAGDEFFLPDNAQFYFHDLPGEKYLRYVPNAKHNLAGSDALESLTAFYHSVLHQQPRPRFAWKKLPDGSLRVTVEDAPREVRLWQATNPKARDFRLDTIGPAYNSAPLAESEPGIYHAHAPTPASGHTAFFVELTYDSQGKYPFKFTTEVSVVPDRLDHDFDTYQKKMRDMDQAAK